MSKSLSMILFSFMCLCFCVFSVVLCVAYCFLVSCLPLSDSKTIDFFNFCHVINFFLQDIIDYQFLA